MNFVFRNSMIEVFFPKEKYLFSDYDSPLSQIDADNYIWMNFLKPSPDQNGVLQQISELESNLDLAIKSANGNSIYILGLFVPDLYSPPIYIENKVIDEIHSFNKNILELSSEFNNICYLDPNHFLKRIGKDHFSSKYYFSSSSIISPMCSENFKSWLEDIEILMSNKRKKMLILDLDNTLWGGVLGEDGYSGIEIDNTYPGNIYLYMQKKIKELSTMGVILTICSKNNLDDVKEGFKKNKNMHLELNDFSVVKANWKEKSLNIKDILSEINIGEDACVFIDDNPLERDLVKNNFPKLIVPEFPSKQYDIPSFINDLSFKHFAVKQLTEEDINKKNQYKIRKQAEKDKSESTTKEEFLRKLCLMGSVFRNLDEHIPRIAQMTQKTNQFNLTTMRLDEIDIKYSIEKGDHIYPLQVKDKYGDHGITALIIASKLQEADKADLSTFLMSCRILGRDIEYEFLKWCLTDMHNQGIKEVTASFIKTKKNDQVNDLYEKAGFELVKEHNYEKNYKIVLKKWLDKNIIEEKYIDIKEVL